MVFDVAQTRRGGWDLIIGLMFLSMACMLGACKDSSGGPSTSVSTESMSTGVTGAGGSVSPLDIGANRPPKISGVPPDTVRAGAGYTFAPVVTDPDNDRLSFSVSGLPSWATFDSQTGRISGTPDVNDIGIYPGVRLAVFDGKTTVALPTYGIYVVATALGAATLNWQPPSERSDGSPLLDLAGYKVYWSTDPADFVNSITIQNPGLTTYMIEHLTPGTWYFVATAFDAVGVESEFSNVGSKVIRP